MVAASKYVARQAADDGRAQYTSAEHNVWRDLYLAQNELLAGHACDEFITGLATMRLPATRIPQCDEVSAQLASETGWHVTPVAALISDAEFYKLLSRRFFPAASFIRCRDELSYLQEPDIFHELFGHTPLLSNPLFAEFSQWIGELGCTAGPDYHEWLARLYWMTIEFGLIDTHHGLRAYGAGIISSPTELLFSLDSPVPRRIAFDALTALRTPYRIDNLQPAYFVLNSFQQLHDLMKQDLLTLIDEARESSAIG